tara:strand:+ start:265 stop:546 length:282 start_codon:yes stop_codon:yes gene_type:complete
MLKFLINKKKYIDTKNIPIIIVEYFLNLNLKKFKKSLISNGDEIPKKKKCHVHNGQADLKLLLIKKSKVVIKDIFVKFLIFFENIKKIPKQFK